MIPIDNGSSKIYLNRLFALLMLFVFQYIFTNTEFIIRLICPYIIDNARHNIK